MFTNILVAVDGSEHSVKAARLGIESAVQSDGQVTFLHVARKFPIPETLKQYIDSEHLTGEPIYAIDDATSSVLKQLVKEARTQGVGRVKSEIREGRPSRTIVAMARSLGADAIFLGSRGLTDIEGSLLGSVSHKVASLAACTVVLVK